MGFSERRRERNTTSREASSETLAPRSAAPSVSTVRLEWRSRKDREAGSREENNFPPLESFFLIVGAACFNFSSLFLVAFPSALVSQKLVFLFCVKLPPRIDIWFIYVTKIIRDGI